MTIRAVIDVGSHSVLLLVARSTPQGPEVLGEEYRITALGSGLGKTGRIDSRAARRTREVIQGYLERCHGLGAEEVVLVGTSALREADNRREALAELTGSTGHEIRVLGREQEARLTRRGALSGLEAADQALVADLGGRSTELSWPGSALSLPIGCQAGTEDTLTSDPPSDAQMRKLRAQVRSHLPKPPPAAGPLVVSGGTSTTLASLDLALSEYRPDSVHAHSISQKRLGELIRRLVTVPLAQRQALAGIEPERADVLPAGSIILDELCRWCRRESFQVSARGLTWGAWLASG